MIPWIQEHLPEGGFFVLMAGALKWFLGREVKRIEDAHTALRNEQKAYEERLRQLETNRVTRNDFDELRMSLMATIINASERIESQVRILTNHLLGRK